MRLHGRNIGTSGTVSDCVNKVDTLLAYELLLFGVCPTANYPRAATALSPPRKQFQRPFTFVRLSAHDAH
jgi:hypothetical protein